MLRSGKDSHNDPYSIGPNWIHAATRLCCNWLAVELIDPFHHFSDGDRLSASRHWRAFHGGNRQVASEKQIRFGSTSKYVQAKLLTSEIVAMAGFGRFKLTDALPEQAATDEPATFPSAGHGGSVGGKGKGKAKGGRKTGSDKGKPALASGLAAEQLREARESSQAKNEGSNRDRMVDIGRGNQQAGRQRAK
jgi:hypothetical protein